MDLLSLNKDCNLFSSILMRENQFFVLAKEKEREEKMDLDLFHCIYYDNTI